MSRTRKNHSAQFKAKVILEALREDTPISDLASKQGVHATVIHRWKKEAAASIESGFSGKQEKISNDQDAHIYDLHAKIGQLTVERDFLERASNRLGLGDAKKSLAQCQLLSISRSGFYYTPKGESPLNLKFMRLIDEHFLGTPYYGSRQMVRYLVRNTPTCQSLYLVG